MPEVWTQGGFPFVIFLNDHEPAHVHVFAGRPRSGTSTLRILLRDRQVVPDRIPSEWKDAQVRGAVLIAGEQYDRFLEAWSDYHR
jgi:hypothetical protein